MPTGAGEPSIRPVAAAMANAIFDATGVRRRVPFSLDRAKAPSEGILAFVQRKLFAESQLNLVLGSTANCPAKTERQRDKFDLAGQPPAYSRAGNERHAGDHLIQLKS